MTEQLKELIKTKKYIMAINTNGNPDDKSMYFKYVGFNDPNEYINVLNKGGSNFEYIGIDSTVKPYIDFEKEYPINTKNKEQTKKDLLKKLTNIFLECCITKLNIGITIDNIVILDGCRQVKKGTTSVYKYSFHITTKNNRYVFKTQAQAKGIVPLMKETERDIYGNIEICMNEQVDSRVYGSTQKLRTIYGVKYNNKGDIPLTPINSECVKIQPKNPLVYLVKYYEDDKIYIDTDNLREYNEPTEDSKAVLFSKITTQNDNIHYTYDSKAGRTLITDYRTDIEKLLKLNGVKQPRYIKHTEFKGKIIYQYCYEYGDKCIYGNEHERNNRNTPPLYIYVNNGTVLCGCYGSCCKSKKNIKLGSVIEKSPLENKINALQCNEPKLTQDVNNDVNKIFNSFITDDTKRALCVKSRCGTGKTHSMYEYINKYLITNPQARILMISTRQSYARSMCNNDKNSTSSMKSLNIVSYLEYKENEQPMNELYKLPKLCISLESLHYITKKWIPYDIIILDESESICRQLFSTTVSIGAVGIYFHLQKLISMSKKVFCLDADLSTPTLTLINGISRDDTLMINNIYNNNKRNYFMTQNEDEWLNDIKSKIILQKKVYIVCLSEKKLLSIRDELEMLLKYTNIINGINENDNRILTITGGMGSIEKKAMCDVNKLWSNVGVLLTTSATGAGVDFSKVGHFDYIYGNVYSGLSPPIEFLQIIHRVRYPTNNNVYVLCNSKMRLPEITYDLKKNEIHKTRTFIYTIDNAKKYIDDLKKTVIHSPKLKSVWVEEKGCMNECSEEWDPNFSLLQYYEYVNNSLNNQANNYLLVLKLLIEQHGDNVIFDPVKARQKRNNNNNMSKLNNVNIKDVDRVQLKNQKEHTAEERLMLEKGKMKRKFNIDNKYIDEDIKEICNVYEKNMNIYENARYVNMYMETKHKEANKDEHQKKLYTTLTQQREQNLLNIYTRFMDKVQYDYSQEFKININDFDEAYKHIQITNTELKCVSRTGTTMENNKVILSVLRHYGLRFEKDRTRTRIGGGKREYGICGYIIKPVKEIYECLYMELFQATGYDTRFLNLVNEYDTYKEYLKPKMTTIPNKNLFIQAPNIENTDDLHDKILNN